MLYSHSRIGQIIMYTLVREIYTYTCGYPEYNVAILGLQKTGKTQIYRAIKDPSAAYRVGLKQQYKPTVGLNTTQVSEQKLKLFIWDLGGKPSIRKIWESYYSSCHGVIYVLDERVEEGLDCLKTVLTHQEMCEIPFVIFIRNAEHQHPIREFINELEVSEQLPPRRLIINLLPHSRSKLLEYLQWLYDEIREVDRKIRQ